MRGAPAIAIVGCLSLAVELCNKDLGNAESLAQFIVDRLDYLVSSRPTAVNMKEAALRFSNLARKLVKDGLGVEELKNMYVKKIPSSVLQ